MQLRLVRRYKAEDYTIGTLYVDDEAFCDTLEDKDRGLDSTMSEAKIAHYKVFGKTAIPTGNYIIDMDTVSQKFKNSYWAKNYGGIVPRLVGVKGFSGVLIHVGNTADDTLGCILVGQNKIKGKVVNSQMAWSKLMGIFLLPAQKRGETITITVL